MVLIQNIADQRHPKMPTSHRYRQFSHQGASIRRLPPLQTITRVVSPNHQILHYNVTVAFEARSLGHRFSRRDDLLFMNHKRRRLAPLLRPRPFALPQSPLLPARFLIQLTGLESRSLLLSLEHRNLLLQLRNLLSLLPDLLHQLLNELHQPLHQRSSGFLGNGRYLNSFSHGITVTPLHTSCLPPCPALLRSYFAAPIYFQLCLDWKRWRKQSPRLQ